MLTYRFLLPNISCASCVNSIESILKQTNLSFSYLQIDLLSKKLTFTLNSPPPQEEVIRIVSTALNSIGQDGTLLVEDETPAEPMKDLAASDLLEKKSSSHKFWGIVGTTSGLAWMAFSLTGIVIPMTVMSGLGVLSILLTIYLGLDSFRDAFLKLTKTKTLTMDALFSISSLTVILVSIVSFFIPGLPMMFDTGLLIFGFRHLGIAIEESIKQSLVSKIQFQDRLPKYIRVMSQGEKTLEAIKLDEIIEIEPGQVIPLDGVCTSKMGLIFENIVNGSPLPREIQQGESVLAGMKVLEGSPPLQVKVTRLLAESYLSKLDQHINKANLGKASLQTSTEKILQYFIPAILLFAILSTLIVGNVFSLALGIKCGISVLVSACPCTLGFITPLAMLIGVKKAAENGVQFKNPKSLEDAAQIDRVMFDLNGTLSKGVIAVKEFKIQPNAEISAREFLVICAAIEKTSEHPFAKAIYEFVSEKKISLSANLEFNLLGKIKHSGKTGMINGKKFTIGNEDMMTEEGILNLPKVKLKKGDHIVYLAQEKKILGYLILVDPVREHAAFAINKLKQLGIQPYILTGTDIKTAKRYGKLVGIEPENIRAGCLTEEKSKHIQLLKEGGHQVAMIGDNSNDSGAVAASDFGIAILSQGTDQVTQNTAGALVQGGSLLPVMNAFIIARQTVTHLKQNLLFSFIYNIGAVFIAGGLLLAHGIYLNPAAGVGLMFLQSTLILLNSYYFKQKKYNDSLPQASHQISAGNSYMQINESLPQNVEAPKLATQPDLIPEVIVEKPSRLISDSMNQSAMVLNV